LLRRPVEAAQYLSFRYTSPFAEAGTATSVGSRGDSYDNAFAESIIGLHKTALVRHEGPWKGMEDLGLATLNWVSWFNNKRLFGPIGHASPVEYEEAFYARSGGDNTESALTETCLL
jgi:putative transposase